MLVRSRSPPVNHFVTAANVKHDSMPWCTVEWMSNPEIVGARDILLVRATFQAGQAHKFHTHPNREEIIYVLEGEAEQWVEDQARRLGPGEMAHIPRNTPHATINRGRVPLKFLAILSPLDAAGDFTTDLATVEPWASMLKL